MKKPLWLFAVPLFAPAACSSAPDAESVLRKAEKAMGGLKSIQYSGAGINGNFGQAISSGAEWPRREVNSYSRTVNYDQKSSSEQIVFAQDVFGGRQQNTEVNGDKAWNVPNGPVPQLANAASDLDDVSQGFQWSQVSNTGRRACGRVPVWELTITDVRANALADLPVPDVVKNAPLPQVAVQQNSATVSSS